MDASTQLPPPGLKVKKSRRGKGDASELASGGWAQNAEAGSSKQAAVVKVVPAHSADEASTTKATGQVKKPRAPKKDANGVPLKPRMTKIAINKAKEVLKIAELKKSWECVPLAQSEVSRIPPVWTRDGRFYITAQNTSIYVHSALSPYARLSTLLAPAEKEHKAPITALLLSPLNSQHVISSAEDGTVKIWDLSSGSVLHSTAAAGEGKVLQMCIGEVAGRAEVFAAIAPKVSSKKVVSYRVVRFGLPTSFPSPPTPITKMNKLAATPTALFISPSSLYLVALAANKAYTFLLPTSTSAPDWKAQLVKFVTDQPLTCGAFAPTDKLGKKGEDWFATGDDKGVIRLWHGLGQAFRLLSGGIRDNGNDVEKRLPTTSLHWHAHAVAALAFTPSGSQLLSVGEESVLVQWHLATGKREYVPRLGGRPIVSLAVRRAAARGQEEEWWMAFADGSVVKVGAGSGKVENVGQGVKIDPLRQIDQFTPYPLTLHPSTSALVLPSSNPGTLQFIDPTRTTLLFDLEVAPSNRVSRRDDKQLVPVAVELVAFSDPVNGSCEWMATVEGRKADEWEGGGEVRNLKIWRWDGQRYMVNTQFPKPHGNSEITSLAFSPLNTPTSPESPSLLTTAIDGSAKLWHIRRAKKSEHGKASTKRPATYELFWASRSSWTYRSLPILSAAFSSDATIIALAHGSSSIISLWDTESNVLLRALDASSDVKDVQHLAFVGAGGRWLVASGQGGVVCWDLLSCERTLFAPSENISSLLSLPAHGTFLTTQIIASSTVVSIYNPTSPIPIRTMTSLQPIRSLVSLPSATGTKHKEPRLNFAAVALSGDLFRLGDDISSAAPTQTNLNANLSGKGKERLSIWQEMFGEHAFLSPSTGTDSALPSYLDLDRRSVVAGKKNAISVYDGPSHTLPPSHLLFDGFMESILAAGSVSPPDAEQPNGGDEVKYEIDEMDGVEETALHEGRKKERGVGAEEVKELEGFFKSLLGLGGDDTAAVRGKKKANGDGGKMINGHHHVIGDDDDEKEEMGSVKVLPVINGKAKSAINGMGTPKSAKKEEEDEEDRVVGTPGTGGSAKKGKKRRAPKDTT